MAEGMSNLAQSIEHVSNTTVPLAKVAFAASLLAESIQDNLDEQTKDIVSKLKVEINVHSKNIKILRKT